MNAALLESSKKKPSLVLRMVIMLILVGLLLGGLVGFNLFKNKMIHQFMSKMSVPPATVTVARAETQEWQPELQAVGTLRAVRGVDVTAEIAGLVRELHFHSGDQVKQGQVLVELNADSDRAQLKALQASADLARLTLDRDRAQLDVQAVSQATVDNDAADLKAKEAQVAQQAALVAKKTIRAPFSGRLGISTLNRGQYLNPGDKVVTLQTIDTVYADFFIPQTDLSRVANGQTVQVVSDAWPGKNFPGQVSAVNPTVDSTTRNVQVQATVNNPRRELLAGMFAHVSVVSGARQKYLTLPQTAITYNPYGSTVFIAKPSGHKDDKGVEGLVAQQVFVTVGPTRGDQVAILKGIDEGMQVITSGQLKVKNGTPLVVNNKILPANDAHPTPQEQ